MKTLSIATVLALLSSGAVALRIAPQEREKEQGQEQEKEKDQEEQEPKGSPLARYQAEEQERLIKEIEGSWILLDYLDPNDVVIEEAQTQGFATFHDGFLQILMQEPSIRLRLLRRAIDDLWVWSGAYRYRIDPLGFLQTQSVMGFDNSEGGLLAERPGFTEEYSVTLQDGELALRRNDGVTYTFRKANAGDLSEETIQSIESRRGISGEFRGDD